MANEYLIQGKLVLDIADAGKQLDNINNKTKGIEKNSQSATAKAGVEWQKFGSKLASVGSKLTKSLTLPI